MLILASQSPRRRELFTRLGLAFEAIAPLIDEDSILADLTIPATCVHTASVVEKLALAKAKAAALLYPQALIVAADTVVLHQGKVLGKPQDKNEAQEMLLSLLGCQHEVITAVCLYQAGSYTLFHEVSQVEFYAPDQFTTAFVARYSNTAAPLDKAGSYGVQDEGALLVKGIRGDFYNVMGLPLASLARQLESFICRYSISI